MFYCERTGGEVRGGAGNGGSPEVAHVYEGVCDAMICNLIHPPPDRRGNSTSFIRPVEKSVGDPPPVIESSIM